MRWPLWLFQLRDYLGYQGLAWNMAMRDGCDRLGGHQFGPWTNDLEGWVPMRECARCHISEVDLGHADSDDE